MRIEKAGRRFPCVASLLAHRPGQLGGRIRPNPINFDPIKSPSVFSSSVQKCLNCFRVMNIAGRDQHSKNQADGAGQDMAFDAPRLRGDKLLISLFPSMPRQPSCGPEATLCESRRPVDGSLAWLRCSRTARVNWAAASAQIPSARKRSYHQRTVPGVRNLSAGIATDSRFSQGKSRH